MDKDSQYAHLHSTLTEMIAQADMLARITSEEGLALRDANINVLNNTVRSKQQIVNGLTELDNRFRHALKQAGLSYDNDIDSFLKINAPNLSAHWAEYVRLMQECDKHNNENSVLVNVGLRHTKQTIDFLRSCIGQQLDPVYTPPYAQRTHSAVNSNLIAKV